MFLILVRRYHLFCFFVITNIYHVITVVNFVQFFYFLMVKTSNVFRTCVLTICICILNKYNKYVQIKFKSFTGNEFK